MKKMKKIAGFLLAAIMVFAMSVVASAASITISKGNANIADGHVYTAYQIFKGTLANDGKTLTNIDWGTGVDGSSLLTELTGKTGYENCKDAADVAEVLTKFNNNSANVDAFADIVSKHLQGNGTDSTNGVISDLADGYYFVKDKNTVSTTGPDALTKFILQVVGDATVNVKADAPEIEKKIVSGTKKPNTTGNEEGLVDANQVSIGDTVTYKWTSTIPDISKYTSYQYIIHDTLSKGLTYTEKSLEVYVDGTKVAEDKYTLSVGDYSTETGTTITVIFKDIKTDYPNGGKTVEVYYQATLNDNAIIGSNGNPNTVYLEYSNNPNDSGYGEHHTPTGPKGTTPEDKVITYTTGVEIDKVDDKSMALPGAEFQINGEKLNKVITTGDVFVEDSNGTYWLLKDGTYTMDDPATDGMDASKYTSTTTKYKKETKTTIDTKKENVVAKAFVGNDGKLYFNGLGEGTYTITELVAPDGYNKLTDPITVEISSNVSTITNPTNDTTITWNYKVTNANNSGNVITVVNKGGSTLPSTGGMGTTILYVIGAILVLVCAVVLISRRRMNTEK